MIRPMFCAPTHGGLCPLFGRFFFRSNLRYGEGKDKVLATWIRDLDRRAPFIDVVAPSCVLVS